MNVEQEQVQETQDEPTQDEQPEMTHDSQPADPPSQFQHLNLNDIPGEMTSKNIFLW